VKLAETTDQRRFERPDEILAPDSSSLVARHKVQSQAKARHSGTESPKGPAETDVRLFWPVVPAVALSGLV
jgi:hypothetical protein